MEEISRYASDTKPPIACIKSSCWVAVTAGGLLSTSATELGDVAGVQWCRCLSLCSASFTACDVAFEECLGCLGEGGPTSSFDCWARSEEKPSELQSLMRISY